MIYLIRSGDTNAYKIGYTASHPVNRVRELQTGSHDELSLIATIEGDRDKEKEIHCKYNSKRIRSNGEWFSLEIQEVLSLVFKENGQMMKAFSCSEYERCITTLQEENKLLNEKIENENICLTNHTKNEAKKTNSNIHLELDAIKFKVFSLLESMVDDKKEVLISTRTISKLCGIHKDTVCRAIKTLIEKGYLEKINYNSNQTGFYKILL